MRFSIPALFALLVSASVASAMPIIRVGFDPDGGTTNSFNARGQWNVDVGGVFSQDNFDTLTVNPSTPIFSGTTGSTGLGNTFSVVNGGLLDDNIFNGGVISGANLGLRVTAPQSPIDGFTWTFPEPVTAFGFFSRDHDGGDIRITLSDGSIYDLQSTNFDIEDLFWGISNLNSPITSVTFQASDPGGATNWDDFVWVGDSVQPPPTPVPEPTSLALWGLGAIGFVAYRRRRRK